ncbi:MAG: DUF177 domain-containing protein [Oscillatoriales cyanobacterium]|nr:MAG: DUF177 domain-containing protein [Oscillatoriales cyanobacterium]
MDSVYIPHLLKAPNHTLGWEFKDFLPGLETLTPVRGHLQVTHRGTFIEVSAQAEGIVTLTCDRCLCQYNQRLVVDAQEPIWLDEAADSKPLPLDQEISTEDLTESLSPTGHFHPADWLYQQLCLELPPQQLCSPDCQGVLLPDQPPAAAEATTDHRWSALANLKQQWDQPQ